MTPQRPDPDALLRARPRGRGARAAGPTQGLPRRLTRRREDLHHVGDRARQAGRGARRGGRRGGDPRPGGDRSGCSRASRCCPAASIDYRGVRLEEFDLDAALARHPAAPAGGRARPYQRARARATPSAGRTSRSCSTPASTSTPRVNIQHFESLNDVVAQITGVTVRETVPDSVLERADEVELVDVTPDVLQQRLREGQGLRPRAGRPRDRAVLPQGQPDRAAGAGPSAHRGAGGRPDARLHGRAGHPRDLGDRRAAAGVHRPEPERRAAGAGGATHGGASFTPSGSRCTSRPRATSA